FLAVIAGRVIHIAAMARPVAVAAVFFGASIVLSAVVRELGGKLCLEDVVNDLKVLYWLAAWMACMVLCRRPEDFRIILYGLVIAGTYAAASVLAVYLLGMEELSPYEGVAASAGGLNTAKGLGGILVVTGLVWTWLTRRSHWWLGAVGFVLCYVALVLTYQRAGLVAGGLAVLWLAGWRIFRPQAAPDRNWAFRPILLSLVPALIITFVLGTADLEKRWNDLGDIDKAGSGRAAFWQEAAAIHARTDLPGKIIGIGYTGLLDNMESRYGSRIHSHTDVLDALVIYGVLGLICWLAINGYILQTILRRGLTLPASATALAVFLVMVLESVFTGQMFGPHVMSFYLLAIFGICLGSQSRRRCAASSAGLTDPDPPAEGCHD
ncbi:MAG: O-antigen ligase family protein, partial [Planctomycetota bacterium]|nr:O-antigen ligase family protein [Planctomycetota bacterium]